MTPFGIRRRIKSLIGGGQKSRSTPARPERPRYKVTFDLPNNGESFEVEGEEGDSFVYFSSNSAYPIDTGCNDSTCGTCRVEVLAGAENMSPMSDHEANTLKENNIPDNYRLGCMVGPTGDGVHVRIENVFGMEPAFSED